MNNRILVLNAGSSSIKFQLFAFADGELDRMLKGVIDGIGVSPRLKAQSADGLGLADRSWETKEIPNVAAALDALMAFLPPHLGGILPMAIGHRVVHGGSKYSRPTRVTPEIIADLEQLAPLAPLHQPNNLAPIKSIAGRFPDLPQIACFDTAFHRDHPQLADRYAIPDDLLADGVRRYGFHGLSYEYVTGRLQELAPEIAQRRVLIAHLGSGASICAIQAGKSMDSTMGFTALDGLPMGTRPGQLDPGIVLFLLRQKGLSVSETERLLYNDCGLKALSGISNDMRVLLSSPSPRAAFAVDYFVHRTAMAVGALTSAIGGLDGFVFTAGIGENSAEVRRRICERLQWLGVLLDEDRNAAGGPRISSDTSKIACYVIPTDEEVMIARHVISTCAPH